MKLCDGTTNATGTRAKMDASCEILFGGPVKCPNVDLSIVNIFAFHYNVNKKDYIINVYKMILSFGLICTPPVCRLSSLSHN